MTAGTIIDVNVSLGNWPFQKFAATTPARLESRLRREGISAGWVSAVESVLHPDPDLCDRALFERLGGRKMLHFVKTVNPTLGNWRESLDEWLDRRGVRAVRVVPNYHGYSLKDACARELAGRLAGRRVPLFVQMRIEDERSQYPLMQVPGVACRDVVALARAFGGVPVIALCAYRDEAGTLTRSAANVHVDLSFVERMDTVAALLAEVPARQVLFGSHTPFLYTRAAVMKLRTAAVGRRELRAIASGNARRLLGRHVRRRRGAGGAFRREGNC